MAFFRLTKKELFHIFLVGALPIHLWSIMLVFNDFSWVIEQKSLWFAFGYLSYSLLVALIESILFFVVIFLLGLLLPKQWPNEKIVAILSAVAVIICFWGIAYQGFYLLLENPPRVFSWMVGHMVANKKITFGILSLVGLASLLLPTYLIAKSEKTKRVILDVSDRLTLLSIIYLAMDFVGIIIVLIRNSKLLNT